jgi:ribonuclease Y
MSLKIALLLVTLAASAGIAFGYFLRWIISLGRKGSMELDIKQMMLDAKEQATRIVTEAETKAEESLKEARSEIKEREEKITKTEERLIKKEDFLDKRQVDIDKETEGIKLKIAEIKTLKERNEALALERQAAIERVTKMSQEEAKEILLKVLKRTC